MVARYIGVMDRTVRALLVATVATVALGCAAPAPDDHGTGRKGSASTVAPAPPLDPTASEALPAGFFEHRGAVVIETAAGPRRFPVELALTDGERQRGLMFRERLDDDAGMLFVFERARIQSFWMKNTRLPLDMIFIAEDGTIAGIVESAEPLTLVSRRIQQPSRYVLELLAGSARQSGLSSGQRVFFEGVPPSMIGPALLAPGPRGQP